MDVEHCALCGPCFNSSSSSSILLSLKVKTFQIFYKKYKSSLLDTPSQCIMHTRYFVLIICLDLLFALRVRNIKENWKVCNEKFGCFPATVPGHVLLDLNITNPYVDFTELNVSQYSLETWTYSTQFSLVGSNTSVYMLKFEKIDTVARVFFLN